MIKLEDITALNDLRARLEQITPEIIDAVARRDLRNPLDNEKVLATLSDDRTKALFAVFMILRTEAKLEDAQKDSALDEQIRQDHLKRHVLANALADVAKETFWFEARSEIGCWNEHEIGLRSDWRVVSSHWRV